MNKYIALLASIILILGACKRKEEKYTQFYSNSLNSFSLVPSMSNTQSNNAFYNISIPDLLATSSLGDSAAIPENIVYKGIYLNKLGFSSKINEEHVFLDNIESVHIFMIKPSIANNNMIIHDTIPLAKLEHITLGQHWLPFEVSALNLWNIVSTSRHIMYKANIKFIENLGIEQSFLLHAQFLIDALLLED